MEMENETKKIKVLDSTYEVHESHLKNGQEKGLIETFEKFEAAYQKTAGGKRQGAGRKKSERKLVKHTVYFFADQLPIDSDALRKYIDYIKPVNESLS